MRGFSRRPATTETAGSHRDDPAASVLSTVPNGTGGRPLIQNYDEADMGSQTVKRRFVDMWALPNLHPTNIELLQKLKSADDRQFGTNMDVVGTVSEQSDDGDWEKTHLVGIRSDLWSPDRKELDRTLNSLHKSRREQVRRQIKRSGRLSDQQRDQLQVRLADDHVMELAADDLEVRRLVLKLFKTNTSRMRWEGTIEELTTSEIHNTIGSKRELLSLAVILPGYEYLNQIQQNHRTFRIPSLFTFCFYDDRRARMWHVTIRRKWVSIGADFTVEVGGDRIGEIDGRLFSLGCDATISVENHPLAESGDFMDLLTLFASSVGYHRAIRKSIRRRVKAVKAGRTQQHIVEDEEMWLRKNPRRRAA